MSAAHVLNAACQPLADDMPNASGGGTEMHYQQRPENEEQESPDGHATALRAVIDLLQSRNVQAGDSINILLAQFELERRGIDKKEFSAGVVLLLGRGWLDMQGNVFYITPIGYQALMRDKTPEE